MVLKIIIPKSVTVHISVMSNIKYDGLFGRKNNRDEKEIEVGEI